MDTMNRDAKKAELKARAVRDGYPPHVGFGEMLSLLDEVGVTADTGRLYEIQEKAARDYAAATLWPKTPADHPGDRSAQAMEIRRQTAEIAERLWLAADAALVVAIHGPRYASA